MENNQVFNLLNRKFLEHKNFVGLVKQAMDNLINKEHPDYNQLITDEVYKKLIDAKKDIYDFLQVIRESNLTPDMREKYVIDYENLLEDISTNISQIGPFVSDSILNPKGGRTKRKTKSKRKRTNKSNRRKRTNKRKSKRK